MARPELLFATIAAGGGHLATARAMLEAIAAAHPERFALALSDYMAQLGERAPAVARFDRRHKAAWRWALRYPLSARLGQRLIDAAPRLTMRVQKRLLADFARAAYEDLTARRPALVISNHGLITAGLSLAKARWGLAVPVLTYATEPFNISAYWADSEAEQIIVPTEQARARLAAMGVPPARLEVVGYPVGQSFLHAPPQAVARRELGLSERPTVLVSLGGEGVSPKLLPLLKLLAAQPEWVTVVICGRNQALAAALRERFASAPQLRVLGFVENMASYLAACDVMIGKAGPASVFEALAVGRPVVLQGYAGLNEWGVVRFVTREGLGVYAPDPARALEVAGRYLKAPELRAQVAARCRALQLGEATRALAARVVAYAEAVAGK